MLSPAQIAQFQETGYLVVEDVLDAGLLERIRAEYDALLDGLCLDWIGKERLAPEVMDLDFEGRLIEAYKAGCDWFQPMDISLPGGEIAADTPMHFGPAVFDLVRAPAILDIVESLIGPEITSNPIQHVRIKPPSTDLRDGEARAHVTGTDWHQDRAVAHEEADQTDMVTVWVAITDATPENGCLQVQPSGKVSMLPHCDKRQTSIADGFIDESAGEPLPVKAGGIVLFHPLVPHGSLENHTDGIRWSFDLRYNRSDQPTGRSHFPQFVARSKAAPETELTDWRVWRQLWEEARARLAPQPHIPIHRWTSDAPHCA